MPHFKKYVTIFLLAPGYEHHREWKTWHSLLFFVSNSSSKMKGVNVSFIREKIDNIVNSVQGPETHRN